MEGKGRGRVGGGKREELREGGAFQTVAGAMDPGVAARLGLRPGWRWEIPRPCGVVIFLLQGRGIPHVARHLRGWFICWDAVGDDGRW